MSTPRQRSRFFPCLPVGGVVRSVIPALFLVFGLLWLTKPAVYAGASTVMHDITTGGPFLIGDTPIDGLTAQNSSPTAVDGTVHFTAAVTSGDNISYTWNYGDDTSGSGLNATHVYTAAGVYTATVTATNDTSTRVATTTVTIGDVIVEVAPNFASIFSPSDVSVNVGDTVVWVLRSGTHSVTADDGSFEQPLGSNWPPYAHTFDTAGDYAYYCVAHGAPGGFGMSGTVQVTGQSSALSPKGYLPLVTRMPTE